MAKRPQAKLPESTKKRLDELLPSHITVVCSDGDEHEYSKALLANTSYGQDARHDTRELLIDYEELNRMYEEAMAAGRDPTDIDHRRRLKGDELDRHLRAKIDQL